MKRQTRILKLLTSLCVLLTFGLTFQSQNSLVLAKAKAHIKIVVHYDRNAQRKAKKVEQQNQVKQRQLETLDQKISRIRRQLRHYTNAHTVESVSAAHLAALNYHGQDVIAVNNDQPNFSQNDLSTKQGPWQEYGNLDSLNRVTAANALLNERLMPHAEREPLNVDPTGWHNKRIAGGWLFNRCHLIGYQLTGQNNNWKNLMTGTRQLNDPDMLRYENEVAYYLRSTPTHYVRYRVTPIFRGDELLARGVEMEGQSINSNAVHFNVYIFNVENDVHLNYADGTSTID